MSQLLFQDTFILRRSRVDNFSSSRLQPSLLKQSLNTQNAIKMQSISLFLDITIVPDLQRKNTDVSKTQGMYHMIYMLFRSSLGKV